jgi:hypothetical protein
MNDDNTVETYTDDANPNVRVRLVNDTDPVMPELDVPTAHGGDRVWEFVGYANRKHINVSADRLGEAWKRFGDLDLIARYLRMFHGATTVERIEVNFYDAYLMFDTPEWRKHVGLDKGQPVSVAGEASEWRAWLEDDVYGIVTERRVQTETTVRDTETGELIREDITPDWDETDAVWGFYGRKYAEQAARDTLKGELTPEGMCANHHDRPSVAVFGTVPLCEACASASND